MDRDFHKTLFFPFERGEIELPASGQSALIIGALHPVRLPGGWDAKTDWVQGVRPNYLALQRAGLNVAPQIGGQAYDTALILCGRHRGQNEAWISEALHRVRPGGLVVIAGGKTDGMDSLRKRFSRSMPIENSLAKYHGIVFWLHRPQNLPAGSMAGYDPAGSKNAEGFFTAPGMFAHAKPDAGSLLLAECLPAGLTGKAADFGAGWGFLSAALLRSSPGISALDICEADFASLQAARRNVEPLAVNSQLEFLWIDLLQEETGRKYDLVVMNPPFHTGRAAEPDIGAAMITAASKALKPGGQLFMVANKKLPYEKVLAKSVAHFEEIQSAGGYKVIKARK